MNLEITYANAAFRNIIGLGNAHSIPKFTDLLSPASVHVVLQHFQNRIKGLSEEYDVEICRLDNQRRIPVKIAAMPLFGADKNVVGAISIIRSIEIEKASEALDSQLQKHSTAQGILQGVAHEIQKLFPFDYCSVSAWSKDGSNCAVVQFLPMRLVLTSSPRPDGIQWIPP